MTRSILVQEWFSAAELAALGLPGLPGTARGVSLKADGEGWAEPNQQGVWWRDRAGRGGGVEYHLCVLPTSAQAKLTLDLTITSERKGESAPDESACADRWRWFERLTDTKKNSARARLEILHTIRELTNAGVQKVAAVKQVARLKNVSPSSIYGWEALVHRVPRSDWLPYLAPRHVGQTAAKCEFAPAAWDWICSEYLRKEQPTLSACYRRLQVAATQKGWAIPTERTVLNRIKALPQAVVVLGREGERGLDRMMPTQHRDRSTLHAMEAVNADFHTWDVFVKFPDGVIDRPSMIALQDIHSGKILAWRITRNPNRCAVRLAIGDMVEHYGIPRHCVLDNGREFASKWITGGTPNRFRFKVRDDEPSGLLVQLGVQVHWATPYRGQSKPIERAFRDMAGDIAKHPAFAGAYTGNSPLTKPENYNSAAVPFETFLRVLEVEIAAHNARPGRQGGICAGRSFDQVFAESYASAKIIKAVPEQRRLWLLAAEARRVNSLTGELELMGNHYFVDALHEHRGKNVVVRFDPDRLQQPVHVYRLDGVYIAEAPCRTKTGFLDADAARESIRNKTVAKRAIRVALAAQKKLTPAQLAEVQAEPLPQQKLDARVVELRFGNTIRTVAAEPELAEPSDWDLALLRQGRPRLVRGE